MKPSNPGGRRDFLKGSLLAGAASLAGPSKAAPAASPAPSVAAPSEQRARIEAGPIDHAAAADADAQILAPGSDFMVDLLRAAGIDYVAAMPGSAFRGLHESIVNYGGNRAPELITCVHEEISAAICHGYAKVAGKPMACLVHSDVGLQHASMAIYNAWADRAPMMVLAGNGLDAAQRRPGIEWLHTMTDLGAMVRDFVKWDDVPVSLQHYSESFMRAYEVSITPPCEPVLLVVDSGLQEGAVPPGGRPTIPRRAPVAAPGADPAAVELAAEMLAAARSPVIVADRAARTPAGMQRLVALAETLNAPVIDKAGRLNIPTTHYLNQSFRSRPLLAQADLVLALDVTDLWGVVNDVPDLPARKSRRTLPAQTKVIGVTSGYAYMKSNVQDDQRYFAADLTIAADSETCLPQIIERLRGKLTTTQAQAIAGKRPALEKAFHDMRAAAATDAARGWDASPIATSRLCMEVWDQIKHLDWGLVSSSGLAGNWPLRLWDFTEHHQYIGSEGGYGVGYGAPGAAGAALAHRDAGRIAVAILGDGDFMVAPGALWTLAHHQIPLLTVLHNNRAWHQESMHLQLMANRRDRGVERWRIGTTLEAPFIDYGNLARGMGIWAEGPISDPKLLRPALARALDVVKNGRPALLDVVTQPR